MSGWTMPWGKHHGKPLAEVPAGYLAWVSEESGATESLKDAAREELSIRLDLSPPSPANRPPPSNRMVVEGIENVFRAAIRKWHPDRGGTHEAALALNQIRDALLEQFR